MEDLGPVLLEKASPWAHRIAYWFVALLVIGCGIYYLGDHWYGYSAPILLVIGAALCWVAFQQMFARTAFHERGIHRVSTLGSETIAYSDVKSFTVVIERVISNGLPLLTSYSLAFEASTAGGARLLLVDLSLDRPDAELNAMVDTIARVMAGRMAEDLKSKGIVVWSEELTLRPSGVEHRARGTGPAAVIPFETIKALRHKDGELCIQTGPNDAPIRVKDREANFYPGLALLKMVLAERRIGYWT